MPHPLSLEGDFLRPHQKAAIIAFKEGVEKKGHRRQIIFKATGVGKTITALGLAYQTGRTLWLAHREELIDQPYEKTAEIWQEAERGVVMADRDERLAKDIVFASVQTLARKNRIERDWGSPFALVVGDECQHSTSDQYKKVIDYFAVKDGALVAGLTATPTRADGKNLGAAGFTAFAYRLPINEAIRHGLITPFTWERVPIPGLDLSKVEVKQGDFDPEKQAEELKKAHFAEFVAKTWSERARGLKTIVFTPTVETAQIAAEELRQSGAKAAWVSGEPYMNRTERKKTLRDFRAGDLEVVANCLLLSEGFDEPSISCAINTRPTRSKGLYCQMMGRSLRNYPGKKEVLIFDITDMASKGLVFAPRLVNRETKAEKLESTQGLEVLDEIEPEPLKEDDEEEEKANGKAALLDRALAVGQFATPMVFRSARVNWIDCGPDLFTLPLGDGEALVLLQEGEVWLAEIAGSKKRVAEGHDMELVMGRAENYAEARGAIGLSLKAALWRSREPSPGQMGLLKKMAAFYVEGLTAGEASDAITAAIVRREYRDRVRQSVLDLP